jgi:hypothetical protein
MTRQFDRISAITRPVRKNRDDRSIGVVAERLIDFVTDCKFGGHDSNPLKIGRWLKVTSRKAKRLFRSVFEFSNLAGILPKLNVMTIDHGLRPLYRGVVILAV